MESCQTNGILKQTRRQNTSKNEFDRSEGLRMKMNVFEKRMEDYWIERPEGIWTFLGDPKEADAIPNEHKDQIHFLSKEGDKIIGKLIDNSRMLFGEGWEEIDGIRVPFNREYFNTFYEYKTTIDTKDLKKWLYERGIPFSKYVFLYGDDSAMMTWKMVIKYSEDMFFAHDFIIIDSSLEWALIYIHHKVYFAKDVTFDRDKHGELVYKINQIIEDAREKSEKENLI
ncbi:MAG: hypothetical protein WC121_07600 [Candidatus Kapaibacterium sp.]